MKLFFMTVSAASLIFAASSAFACNTSAAKSVDSNMRKLATVGQDSGRRTIKWGMAFHQWPRDQQLQMAQIAADADACLSGGAKEILFYSPSGKLNAVASPTSGIRLVD